MNDEDSATLAMLEVHYPAVTRLRAENARLRDELNEEIRAGQRFEQDALRARADSDRDWDALRYSGGAS